KNMAVTGNTVPKPVIIVTQSFVTFAQTVGSPALVQNYTVAGNNLTGNIIITAPAHYQVSVNNGTSWATTVTLTRINGEVAPTTILVRMNVPITGMFSGILAHTSPDAVEVDVTLNGYSKVAGEYTIYPVPASRTIFVAHPITAEKAKLTFYNMAGQLIATYYTQPGTIETPIDVTGLPQGSYFLEYRIGDTKVMMRFIKN
ncbi:MAG TPA: T9SS type A sorting domain-containing protein, partial [Chitinophagaceae bacterium]